MRCCFGDLEQALRAFGVTREALNEQGDGLVIRRIAEHVARSVHISYAVVLALDGVVDADGRLDMVNTQMYMPNDFVAAETARFDNLLFGASINPYRRDALARLARVKAAGAVLVKWIPGIMAIDPADKRITPFYHRVKALGLPLLIHTGDERAFAAADDRLGDPLRLRLALDIGVTVIAAHLAGAGRNEGQSNYERLLPLFAQYSNLYADISALTQFNRLGVLRPALTDVRLEGRLVYGSDWPLQFFPLVSPWYQWPGIDAARLKTIGQIANPWDRDVALNRAMGMGDDVFATSRRLVGQYLVGQ